MLDLRSKSPLWTKRKLQARGPRAFARKGMQAPRWVVWVFQLTCLRKWMALGCVSIDTPPAAYLPAAIRCMEGGGEWSAVAHHSVDLQCVVTGTVLN